MLRDVIDDISVQWPMDYQWYDGKVHSGNDRGTTQYIMMTYILPNRIYIKELSRKWSDRDWNSNQLNSIANGLEILKHMDQCFRIKKFMKKNPQLAAVTWGMYKKWATTTSSKRLVAIRNSGSEEWPVDVVRGRNNAKFLPLVRLRFNHLTGDIKRYPVSAPLKWCIQNP